MDKWGRVFATYLLMIDRDGGQIPCYIHDQIRVLDSGGLSYINILA